MLRPQATRAAVHQAGCRTGERDTTTRAALCGRKIFPFSRSSLSSSPVASAAATPSRFLNPLSFSLSPPPLAISDTNTERNKSRNRLPFERVKGGKTTNKLFTPCPVPSRLRVGLLIYQRKEKKRRSLDLNNTQRINSSFLRFLTHHINGQRSATCGIMVRDLTYHYPNQASKTETEEKTVNKAHVRMHVSTGILLILVLSCRRGSLSSFLFTLYRIWIFLDLALHR